MRSLGVEMGEEKGSGFLYVLCLLVFLCELTMISYTGIRVMFPIYIYGDYKETSLWEEFTEEQARFFFPLYHPEEENPVVEKRKDVFFVKALETEEVLTLVDLENSGFKKELDTEDFLEKMQEENQKLEVPQIEIVSPMDENMPDRQPETQAQMQPETQPGKQTAITLEELEDYETLVKRFYTIDSITGIGPEELNARKLGSMDMTIKQTPDKPQILIYHTHSQEGFADSVAGDESTTIMGAGERLKALLEGYGYNVIHHTGKYDVKSRDSAYSKALPEITRLLEENPSIEVVIDLHRDAMDENTRLVMDLNGRPTARFMFFNGISRTIKNGKIGYLYNENLETNLAFSFQAKWKAEEYYPGLTRRNYINAYRYNMHVCPKTMLIELGAQNNTLEEILNACEPLAHILHMVLSGEG